MDEGTRDECQLARRFGILVGVVFDKGFVDGPGPIFLTDQIEYLCATQIALEFIGDGV